MPLTNWSIAITVLLAAGIALSALRYARSDIKISTKIVLITLRTGWIVALLLAFLEPAIHFERFESGKMRIPVLIDASASMRNFSPDDYVMPFLDTLASLQSRTGGRVSFEYFLFGDSTRKLTNNVIASEAKQSAISFADSRSSFPAALDESGGRLSNNMIIVSDGHWTKPRGSGEIFPRNSMYYLTLPESSPNPFVTISCDAPEASPVDSQFAISVTASGYARESGKLTVSLKEKNRILRTETAEVGAGYFAQTIQFKASSSRPGRKLYTTEAFIATTDNDPPASDSAGNAAPPSAASFVHQTVPHFLAYSIYSAKPTLDRRYVAQALASNQFFKEAGRLPSAPTSSNNASPDILFIFDWDSASAQMLRGLPRHAAAVFLGTLPCSSSSITAPPIAIRQSDNNAFSASADLRAMPPPSEIITCKQLPATSAKRLLYATVNTGLHNNKNENVPILFSGRFRGTQSVFCPVRGIWRWDFWPMSSDRTENELFGFSNIILSTARELLLDNISDQLILYPASMLYETDSAKFFMSLPAAVPIFEQARLSLQIQGADTDINIDTTMDYHPSGLNKQPISRPPLPPGRYAVSSTLTAPGVKAAFSDSFTVNKDMSELSVLAQNTQYLQQFAQPLDMKDDGMMNSVFDSWAQASADRNTVTETIRIRRSWLLLGILLALFAAELVLRRWREID